MTQQCKAAEMASKVTGVPGRNAQAIPRWRRVLKHYRIVPTILQGCGMPSRPFSANSTYQSELQHGGPTAHHQLESTVGLRSTLSCFDGARRYCHCTHVYTDTHHAMLSCCCQESCMILRLRARKYHLLSIRLTQTQTAGAPVTYVALDAVLAQNRCTGDQMTSAPVS